MRDEIVFSNEKQLKHERSQEVKGEERGLTQRILRHSLAFPENSGQVYWEAVEAVKRLAGRSDQIYPPTHFPSIRRSEPESAVHIVSVHDSASGRINPAEAVAIMVLLSEASALTQAFARDWETTEKLSVALTLPEGGWQSDAIEGFADFGNFFRIAARVRDRMLSGEGRPERRTLGEVTARDWWDRFHQAIELDDMVLGINTAEAITKAIGYFAERDIPHNPEGARNNREIWTRIISRKYGVELARKLYLEVLELASHELPSKIGLKETVAKVKDEREFPSGGE